MRKVWVVVANGSLSKIYNAESNKTLTEIRTFEHPESRLPNHELVSDGPGRIVEPRAGAPHFAQREMSPKLKEKDVFATQLAEFLATGLKEGAYETLYLIASTQFCSLLHHHLTSGVQKAIHTEIHKDLTHVPLAQIRDHLPPVL